MQAEPGGSEPDRDGKARPGPDADSGPEGEPGRGASSRRPPRVTRDTARPEGGGRAAPGRAPAPARQWPLLAVLGMTGLGLLVVAFDAFRIGTIIIGLAMIGGAVLRWSLPSVGMLAVRSRFTDIFTYGGLGLAILLLALMAQPHPWLKIPFLDDVLHFTVQ
ncbi:membrane protein [Streptomyces sp. NRRL B-1568]|nr:membrane protein [Streptomyces sp. NRRL B-1568]